MRHRPRTRRNYLSHSLPHCLVLSFAVLCAAWTHSQPPFVRSPLQRHYPSVLVPQHISTANSVRLSLTKVLPATTMSYCLCSCVCQFFGVVLCVLCRRSEKSTRKCS